MRKWLLYLAALLPVFTYGQNLDKIGQKDMVTVSGGMNSNFVVNHVEGQEQFRDPLSWVLSGNVTVNILDVALPFTFSFSNAGRSYTQPFNMTALHPTYKNWKAHIGITSMSLSKYTYSGMNFAGGGVEYTPKKWFVKAFGGRLKKAVEYDAEVNNINNVAYQRYGVGVNLGYKGKSYGTEIILFKGFDDATSLKYATNNPELTARDNVVASFKGNVSLWNSLRIKAEVATSLLTQDILANDPTAERPAMAGLVQGNQTTGISNAYNASIDYRKKGVGIGAKYERIDPGYATLGALYFNDDLENITVNPSVSLFKNKLTLSGSTGFQRNNLDNSNASKSERWIGSANLTAQVFKGFSLNANYSNMSSFTKRNPTADPFYTVIGDTLNYYQVSENMSGTISYMIGDSIKHMFNLTGSYAKSQNITGRLENAGAFGLNVTTDSSAVPIDVYNGMFAHRISFSRSGLNLGWTVNGNHTIAMGVTNTYIGPGANFSKALLDKKMSVNGATTYNQQLSDGELSNHVLNYRLGLRYSPKLWDKKYGSFNMAINGTLTNRLPVDGGSGTQNLTIIANIGYQF